MATCGALLELVALLWLVAAGCSPRQTAEPVPLSDVWRQSQTDPSSRVFVPAAPPQAHADPIAMVNGQPIDRDVLVRLLLAGRGGDVLEQLIVLELARGEARAAGLTVTEDEVDAEYDQALRGLLSQLPPADETALDREAGQSLLERVLVTRGMSQQEHRLGLWANVYLRKLALARMNLSEQELRQELPRAYGRRVRVRHIQLASSADVERVRRTLRAGADFAETARRFSANPITAPSGGLLKPFSRDDPDVPGLLREAAFSLKPGQVSNPIRAGNWYHVIRLEELLPAADVTFDEVRGKLLERLRARRLPGEMQRLSAELFDRARLEILDPVLEAEFFKRHPDRRRSPR